MMAVVVLYVMISTGSWKNLLNKPKLGFGTAALNGPRSAMTLTWRRTVHFIHRGQFSSKLAKTIAGNRQILRMTYQRIIPEAARLRIEWISMRIKLRCI